MPKVTRESSAAAAENPNPSSETVSLRPSLFQARAAKNRALTDHARAQIMASWKIERLPMRSGSGVAKTNPTRQALPSQLRAAGGSGDDRKLSPTRPANENKAITPAQNPEKRDHIPRPCGWTKFNGMRKSAGNGPKYIRALPFTLITSGRIASRSTPGSPRKRYSACESNASPSTSLTKR